MIISGVQSVPVTIEIHPNNAITSLRKEFLKKIKIKMVEHYDTHWIADGNWWIRYDNGGSHSQMIDEIIRPATKDEIAAFEGLKALQRIFDAPKTEMR